MTGLKTNKFWLIDNLIKALKATQYTQCIDIVFSCRTSKHFPYVYTKGINITNCNQPNRDISCGRSRIFRVVGSPTIWGGGTFYQISGTSMKSRKQLVVRETPWYLTHFAQRLGTYEYEEQKHNHKCRVPKSRAAVDYTLSGVEPHGPTRGVWPMATVTKHSQSYLVTSNI